jgi:hypothetical protein
MRPLLDEEVQRLPDKYRGPVVLCDLEGKTRREAARQLGIPEGTLSGRLTTARRLLAKRLARRGVTLLGGALAACLSGGAALARVPAPLVRETVQATPAVAAGQAAAAGVISAKVAALTQGVIKAMFLTKLRTVAIALLTLGLIGAGAGLFSVRVLAQKGADAQKIDSPKGAPRAGVKVPGGAKRRGGPPFQAAFGYTWYLRPMHFPRGVGPGEDLGLHFGGVSLSVSQAAASRPGQEGGLSFVLAGAEFTG